MTKHRYMSSAYGHRTVSGSSMLVASSSGIQSADRSIASCAWSTINRFDWSMINGSSKSISGGIDRTRF